MIVVAISEIIIFIDVGIIKQSEFEVNDLHRFQCVHHISNNFDFGTFYHNLKTQLMITTKNLSLKSLSFKLIKYL